MGATSRTGSRLGAFTVGPPLGRGGTAEIYHATETTTGRAVALKVLREDLMQYEEIVARFYREARAAERVRHPNVVDVYAVGKDDHGTPFIVQEFLHGEDLNRYVTRCGGKLSVEHTLLIMMPVIEAVAYAHQRSVVHRDLKPENVFLSKVGDVVVPKLLDFGISRIQESSEARLTTAGESIGTPAYMSPEQIHSSGDVDSRTDVWSLGVMLFELLAGRLPYPNPDPQALFVEIATKPPPRLLEVARDAPLAIGKIVDRCLRHDKMERYPSAVELSKDVKQTVASDPDLAAKLPHIAAASQDFVDRRGLTDWTGTPDQGVPAVRTGRNVVVDCLQTLGLTFKRCDGLVVSLALHVISRSASPARSSRCSCVSPSCRCRNKPPRRPTNPHDRGSIAGPAGHAAGHDPGRGTRDSDGRRTRGGGVGRPDGNRHRDHSGTAVPVRDGDAEAVGLGHLGCSGGRS